MESSFLDKTRDYIMATMYSRRWVQVKEMFTEYADLESSYWILGQHYADNAFLSDLKTRPWFTYRYGFPIINGYATDSGWGCMVRVGQSIIANAWTTLLLGRDWRLQDSPVYVSIMSNFLDTQGNKFSLHNIVATGQRECLKPIGEWFGTHTIAMTLKHLVNNEKDKPFGIYVATDGTIYDHEITEFPLLILIPLRLGLHCIPAENYEHIKGCLKLPWCNGIAGGKPNSALFFVGFQEDKLIYLDPHTCQEVVPIDNISFDSFSSYQLDISKPSHKIPISQLDPNLLLSFIVHSRGDYEELLKAFSELVNHY
eukprot:NODE_19_length_39463_cov_0.396073.p11 type:complete len:312 gc:universal NODE_19_length_39463_cov_0.396073:32148-31213(-)